MSQPIRVGINGFGRIGRRLLRLALERENFEIVGINSISDVEQVAHLFKYDSVHGRFEGKVRMDHHALIIETHDGEKRIPLSSERDPANIPWSAWETQYVYECTGIFTSQEKVAPHFQDGVKKVIISAPSPDADITLCLGVNEGQYDPKSHHVISNASCTTHCLAPLVQVLDNEFGVARGTMLTVHSYTNDQALLDGSHKDLRRARAAAVSQIPTQTGAAKAVGLVIPHLKGKIDGLSIRVPTPNVSMVDFTGELKKNTTKKDLQNLFEKASLHSHRNILGYTTEPLVSIDFNGRLESSIIDGSMIHVIDGNFVKVISWYDNESGFSARMLDLTSYLAKASHS